MGDQASRSIGVRCVSWRAGPDEALACAMSHSRLGQAKCWYAFRRMEGQARQIVSVLHPRVGQARWSVRCFGVVPIIILPGSVEEERMRRVKIRTGRGHIFITLSAARGYVPTGRGQYCLPVS
jgi:hypothetical protein